MILLDTHIWVWLVGDMQDLRPRHRELLSQHEVGGLGVSVISCWEVAKLVEKGRLALQQPVGEWITAALNRPHVTLISLTPEISVDSTQLPAGFHSDPADQLIVATSRILNIPLLTADSKILNRILGWPVAMTRMKAVRPLENLWDGQRGRLPMIALQTVRGQQPRQRRTSRKAASAMFTGADHRRPCFTGRFLNGTSSVGCRPLARSLKMRHGPANDLIFIQVCNVTGIACASMEEERSGLQISFLASRFSRGVDCSGDLR